MGTPQKPDSEDEITFEEAIQNLEQIVKEMESDRLPLDELVHRYEKGTRLLRTCQTRIEQAEQRIERIASGKSGLELVPFEPNAGEDDDKSSGKSSGKSASGAPPRGESVRETDPEGEGEIQLF